MVQFSGSTILARRDELESRCTEQRTDRDKIRNHRQKQELRKGEISDKIAEINGRLDDARAERDQIAYDAEAHRSLEAVRDQATQLRAESLRIATETRKAEQKEQEAAAARDEAVRASQQAEQNRAGAWTDLEEARTAHSASHLRLGLNVGQPCPVCLQEVAALPSPAQEPILKTFETAAVEADRMARAAAQLAEKQGHEAAGAEAGAFGARKAAVEAHEAMEALAATVTTLRCDLDHKVGHLVIGFPGESLEDRVIAACDSWALRGRDHARAEADVKAIEQELALKRQEIEGLYQEIASTADRLSGVEEQLRRTEESLQQLRERILAVTDADDPKAERDQINTRIKNIDEELARSVQIAAVAERDLEGARGRIEPLRRITAEAALMIERLTFQADQEILHSPFQDADAVRAAALPPTMIETLQARIDRHHENIRILQSRIGGLITELDGRRVTDEELKQAEEDRKTCHDRHQETQRGQASTADRIRLLEEKLQRAKKLRCELDDHRRQHRIYDRLASDLRSDRFQAYLLEEALAELVRGASQQLGRLTTDRYGLDFVEDQIVAIDRDNAGERRGTDTLSGGETFLASLALALELSDQVQRAQGAIHLDCLFIDEGFGTLDPDTLRVVADSVRSLQVGGRMVGIITHIPELKEEFDQRLIVAKEGGTS